MTERGPEEKLDKLRQLMLQENALEEGGEESGQPIPSEEFRQLLASLTPAQVCVNMKQLASSGVHYGSFW